jgi:hypothetical protein
MRTFKFGGGDSNQRLNEAVGAGDQQSAMLYKKASL